ncbi:MAG: hypothetical protein MJZ31_06270 [Bacteroidales bacterium]|nr:hypothetical protein [Bacteroidales bacterium]
MKKLFLTLAVAAASMVAFAQESAIELKNAGNAELKAKNLQGALDNYEKAIVAFQAEGEDALKAEMATVYNAADCARKLGKGERAIELFTMCEAEGYKADMCAYNIAKSMEKMEGKDADRKAYLEAAVEKYTEGKAASFLRKDLAKFSFDEGKAHYEKGAEILKEVASAKPEQYAEIQGRAKEEFKLALPLIEKAGQIDPTNKNVETFVKAIKDQLK